MKKAILEWAKELTKTTILSNIKKIDSDVGELKLSTNKSGGTLRTHRITSIISGMMPIADFLTLNNEAILTNSYVSDHLSNIDDTKRDALISLTNVLFINLDISITHLRAEEQTEALANKLIFGYSKFKATEENEDKKNKDLTIVKKNPLLIPIFVLSVYKDAIFSAILEVVEETYRRE